LLNNSSSESRKTELETLNSFAVLDLTSGCESQSLYSRTRSERYVFHYPQGYIQKIFDQLTDHNITLGPVARNMTVVSEISSRVCRSSDKSIFIAIQQGETRQVGYLREAQHYSETQTFSLPYFVLSGSMASGHHVVRTHYV